MEDILEKIEGKLQLLLKIGIATLLLLSLSLIGFITLNFDEAWLISRYQEIIQGKVFLYKLTPQSFSNGGIYAIAGSVIYSIFGNTIWIYRLVSYVSLLVIFLILWRWSMKRWSDSSATLIIFAVFLGMWGTVELSALAYACVVAMMLVLIGLNFLVNANEKKTPILALLLTGMFMGLAASARLNLLALFPAFFLEALLSPNNRITKLKEACYISFFGAVAFLVAQSIIGYITPETSKELLDYSIEITGLGNIWPDYPRILNKWIVANGFLPIFMMVGITAYAFLDKSKLSRAMRLLVLFGWIHWLAWILRAPIAHLRYFWPTVAAFGVVGGFGLASLYMWAKDNSKQALCSVVMVVALGFTAHGFGNGFRSLIHGEGNILSWEWSRETPLSNYRWIRYKPQQKQMAEYLNSHVKDGEVVGVLGVDLELEVLSGTKVVPLKYYFEKKDWNETPLPKKLLITPMIGTYLYLDPSLEKWMEANLSKEAQFGHYILYQVEGDYPANPDMFRYSHTPHPSFPRAGPFF